MFCKHRRHMAARAASRGQGYRGCIPQRRQHKQLPSPYLMLCLHSQLACQQVVTRLAAWNAPDAQCTNLQVVAGGAVMPYRRQQCSCRATARGRSLPQQQRSRAAATAADAAAPQQLPQ